MKTKSWIVLSDLVTRAGIQVQRRASIGRRG